MKIPQQSFDNDEQLAEYGLSEAQVLSWLGFDPKVVETPAFKQWFGRSVVRHSNGRPRVMYHGTTAKKPFSVFKRSPKDVGFHFGTTIQAVERALGDFILAEMSDPHELIEDVAKDGTLLPVFLRVERLVRVKDSNVWDASTVSTEMARLRIFTKNFADHIKQLDAADPSKALDVVRQQLHAVGVDGFIYDNNYEGAEGDSIVVFHPNQIKSATKNVGTFNLRSPDIFQGAFGGLSRGLQ